MSSELHPVDKHMNYKEGELEQFLVFCLLDRASPYENVCKTFNLLQKLGLTTRQGIIDSNLSKEGLAAILSTEGAKHRFPNETARFLYNFSRNPIDLHTATRDELVKNVDGIGYKLASMFLRNTRGENYAVLDVHIKRWLKERGITARNYKELEAKFVKIAEKMGTNPYHLDMQIWQERRIGNRKRKEE